MDNAIATYMNKNLLRSLTVLLMEDDPSILGDDERKEFENWVNFLAKEFGYTDWIDAFHQL